jgi:hypothetical protein
MPSGEKQLSPVSYTQVSSVTVSTNFQTDKQPHNKTSQSGITLQLALQ